MPRYYSQALGAFPGMAELPTGVQVALLSLVFNRGSGELSAPDMPNGDMLDTRWEMRELRGAVLSKDLVWIYWHFESMRRVWAQKTDGTSRGLIRRRERELTLIYPYVATELQIEAMRQRGAL